MNKEKCIQCNKMFEDYFNRPLGEDRCKNCVITEYDLSI